MKKLPEYLYHYTSAVQMQWIVEDQLLKTTVSNLKFPVGPTRYEPIARNGEIVGQRVANEYANYHPVVWLTANDKAIAEESGLHEAKLEARFVIPTDKLRFHILRWTDFTDKYHAAPYVIRALKSGNGADWKNWYVCEIPIPLDCVERIEIRTEDGTYRPIPVSC